MQQSQINLNEDQRSFHNRKPLVIMIPYCQSQQAEESFEGLAYAVAAVAAAAALGPGLYGPSGDTGACISSIVGGILYLTDEVA